MDAPTTRIFRPARIVALALIALAAVALAYLRFAPGDTPVSVPAGVKAGELTLRPCTYATENGSYAAECGTLVVPENRADPRSRLIALPVTRIRARSEDPAEPIFRLEGGPGLTNMQFKNASRLADTHDVVLVGYRGVDGSVRLDCPEVASALTHSTDFLGAKSLRTYSAAFGSCAKRLQNEGVDLAGYTLPQRVDDLDAARRALGYGRIDLLSESAGTRAAMIYSWRYPESIHRSVMIGVNPPGGFVWSPQTTDGQIRRYTGLCARDDSCRKQTDDLAASMRRTAADLPDRWWFLPIKNGNVRLASFFGLMESTAEAAPLSAPMTLNSWLGAAKGDASGFWFQSLLADFAFPKAFVWGDYGAASRADARAAERYFSSGGNRGSILGDPGTEFLWGGGRLLEAWPANESENQYTRVQRSNVETLLIGGTLDFATPPQVATNELLPHLPNGHQVVLPELGHTTDFWTYQPEASSRLLNGFFDSGTVDESLYTPAKVDFTPEVTQTALAKGIAGTMLGLAALVVLSLVWMPYRVHKRGGFGRKASASLRSLYPVMLGLGGWFLGALVVMATLPGVPLDDDLLAVLSVGVPIGLGIYWAWVRRDWTANTKIAGLVAAAVGALVGARLGFNATAGLLALVTAIVGAAAGANLALILHDIARERRAGRPRAEAAAPNHHPSRTEPTMSTKRRYHLAARMGHWSATHWKTAVFGWLGFVLAATAVGMMVGQKTTSMQSTNVGESHRADQILQQAGFTQSDPLTEIVVVQSDSATVPDPSFRSTVDDVVRAVTPFTTIQNIRSPLEPANAAQISADGHTALVEWEMKGSEKDAAKNIDALTRTTSSVAKSHPGFFVGEAGTASSSKAFQAMFGQQLAQAGERSIPLTLLVLLLVFGSLAAASIPLLLALSSVIATTGLIAPISHLIAVDGNVTAVILLVGLAVGVDYTLFYLKREREERSAGRPERAALEAAAATSGRSVLISGLTVIVAMAGMLFTRDQTFMGFGIATMLVVAVAMIGSLTVLPALLAKLGDRVEKGRIPLLGRLRRPGGDSRVWAKLLTPALRRPAVSALVAAAALVALALPIFSLHTTQSGLDSVPRSTPTVEAINRMEAAFPGTANPAVVAVRANTDSPAFNNAVGALRAEALATGQLHEPIRVEVNHDHNAARIVMPVNGNGVDRTSTKALLTLRNGLLPDTLGKMPDVSYAVTGRTAVSYDANETMKSSAPFVFGFVIVFAFGLLLASFRSLVVAAKAVLLNLLSVGAAYGVVIAVFQYGWGAQLLEFTPNGGIAQWLPLFMFVILFGLSMDYHVFIISRIREAYDRGLSTQDAVEHGIKTTAGVVTSAAVVMVGAFAIFATLPILDMNEMGVGLAAAVLIDATIVRAVLLPATMKLLGDWNWYLPRWLNWLPRLDASRNIPVEPAHHGPGLVLAGNRQ
jgi:uncharacterized membrane protein YdfJ with MMPL/SSD domain/pimeloyl-ACP methyl ester carboxylesterase